LLHISHIILYCFIFVVSAKIKEELGKSNVSFGPTAINERIATKYGTGPYTEGFGAN
jgi:hypothetical protein